MLKVDVTQGGNPLHEQLILHYEVKGVPTIVFLDRNGVEHRDVRLVDYLPPEQFLEPDERTIEKRWLKKGVQPCSRSGFFSTSPTANPEKILSK